MIINRLTKLKPPDNFVRHLIVYLIPAAIKLPREEKLEREQKNIPSCSRSPVRTAVVARACRRI